MIFDIGVYYLLTLKYPLIGLDGLAYMAVYGKVTKTLWVGSGSEYQLHIGSLIVMLDDIQYAIKAADNPDCTTTTIYFV